MEHDRRPRPPCSMDRRPLSALADPPTRLRSGSGARTRRGERRDASPAGSAGRSRHGEAPLNARLATVAKPSSSSRSASSRCAVRSADGNSPVDLHAPAVDAPAAGPRQQRAGLRQEPDAEPAALEREPGARVQRARLAARADRRAARAPPAPRARQPARGRRPDEIVGASGWRTATGIPFHFQACMTTADRGDGERRRRLEARSGAPRWRGTRIVWAASQASR